MTEKGKILETQDGLSELFLAERGAYTSTAGRWSMICSPRIKDDCFKVECVIDKGYSDGWENGEHNI